MDFIHIGTVGRYSSKVLLEAIPGQRCYLDFKVTDLEFSSEDGTHDTMDQGQGSHRLEKYLNIQDCLEKSLKIKFALKST